MIIDFKNNAAVTPNMNIQKLLRRKDDIEVLLLSIVSGENPIVDESYQDWRIKIESMANDLLKDIYD